MSRRVRIREPKDHERTLGELMYWGRVKHNLTQTELADMIGATQKYISLIERNRDGGVKSISLDKLLQAYTILGVSLDVVYFKLGMLPPDIMDALNENWPLYDGILKAVRGDE